MAIHPIESRYGRKEVRELFDNETKLQRMLEVEAALARAHAKAGNIPDKAAEEITRKANTKYVKWTRVKEIEAEIDHDVMAIVEALAEQCPEAGKYVHLGATSNDIQDTALALQLKEYIVYLKKDLEQLKKTLLEQAEKHKKTITIGRTHGQHAVPITYGIRFSVWLDEVQRHRQRLLAAKDSIAIGKIAGATGSHAAIGPIGIELQQRVMKELGLNTPVATTQIIQRDRHAEAILVLTNLAASIDKFATDLRALQRTEIGEIYEPFASGKQVGSSAMPHKRNPVTCEKISGLARYVRSLAMPALENVISWEERDITHSSAERFVIPQAFILTDYLIREMTRVIGGLEIDLDAVKRNLQSSTESTLSEYILTQLTKAGMERPKAHEILRKLSIKAQEQNTTLSEIVRADMETTDVFAKADVNVSEYYDSIKETSRRIVNAAIRKYKETIDMTK